MRKKTKSPNIVFYCSWGGYGHIARAHAIISHLPSDGSYTLASSENWPFKSPNKNFSYKRLPRPKSRIRFSGEDIIVQDYQEKVTDTESYKKHLHSFIDLLKKERPDLVVVDNPAEIALFSKIMGCKTVLIYESLKTNDLRWRLAWKNADKVLAPYPKIFLEKIKFPYINNTCCVGGFTRFETDKSIKKTSLRKARKSLNLSSSKKYILITVGKGDTAKGLIKKILKNVRNLKGYEFLLLYHTPDKEIIDISKKIPNLRIVSGTCDNVYLYLIAADIIITGAGYNSVMEICYFQKPAVAIPLDVIYTEQFFKAKTLAKIGAVKLLDPEKTHLLSGKIKELEDLKNIKEIKKGQRKIVDGKGAQRAANCLLSLITKKSC